MTRPHILRFLLLPAFAFLCASRLCAQKSTTLVEASPVQQYAAIRTTVEQLYQHGLLADSIQGNNYDLSACGIEPNDYIDTTSDESTADDAELQRRPGGTLYNLVFLAETTVLWRNAFRKLGVPEEVWEPLVSRYEKAALGEKATLDYLQDEAPRKQIAKSLNEYRKQSKPSLPTFVVNECAAGGGYFDVHLDLQPPDGQLFLIPVFLYKLCQAQRLDPLNRRSCDRWREVIQGSTSYVSGDYIYLARWTDGTVRCGPIGFSHLYEGGKTFRITKVGSPECNPGW